MHFSAKRGLAIACRLSVCLSIRPSVTLVNWIVNLWSHRLEFFRNNVTIFSYTLDVRSLQTQTSGVYCTFYVFICLCYLDLSFAFCTSCTSVKHNITLRNVHYRKRTIRTKKKKKKGTPGNLGPKWPTPWWFERRRHLIANCCRMVTDSATVAMESL